MPATIAIASNAPATSPAPVSGLFARFIDYVDAAPRTVTSYSRALHQFHLWLGRHGIATPTREDVKAYRDELSATHKPGTVRTYLTAVKVFFQWASTEGLFPNIADRIKAGRVDRAPKKDALTSRQVRMVLEAMPRETESDLRDYAIMWLLVTAGLRTIEAVRLDVGDISSQCDRSGVWVQGKGHTEKDTFCPIEAPVEDAIRAYLSSRGPVASSSPLFASTSNNSRGHRLSTTALSVMVKSAFRRVGLDSERLTAHSTRHTAVTLALLGGASIQEASDLARHASLQTTTIYAHNIDRLRNPCGSIIVGMIS